MDTRSTVGEVAYLTGVTSPTVRRVAAAEGIAPETTAGGHRRFTCAQVEQLVAIVGKTPSIDGLTRPQVQVLAAFSARPFGFRSIRAVARATTLSPTAAGRAAHTLMQQGLIEEVVETVAEGIARSMPCWRLRIGEPWLRIAGAVASTVLPIAPAATAGATRIPRRFWHLFWDVEPAALTLANDSDFIATRLLLGPDLIARSWALRNLSTASLRHAATNRAADPRLRAMIHNAIAARDRTEVQSLLCNDRQELEPGPSVAGLAVGSLSDLMATKLKVTADRGELRDYFDLMAIEQQSGRRMEEGLLLYMARYGVEPTDNSIDAIIRGFGYFDDVETDPYLVAEHGDDVFDRVAAYWRRRQPEILASLDPR